MPFEESRPSKDWINDNKFSNRIHNGYAATGNQFPHQVALNIPIGTINSVCGGSVLSNLWILTAAHCLFNRNQVTIRVGTVSLNSGGHSQTSFLFHNHPNFHTTTFNNDVSLVRVPAPLPLSAAIQVIRLPTRGQAAHHHFLGVQATVSGWGEVVPGSGVQANLRWVNVRVISNDQCRASFSAASIVDHVVCTVGYANPSQGVCGSDSGGPLYVMEGGIRTQMGIVAFGAGNNAGGCAGGHPSAYMRPSHFLDWIASHTGIQPRN